MLDKRKMKILTMVSYIDLVHRIGCTPSFWQLFQNLYLKGVDNIVIPYAGKNVETLWWRVRENPCLFQYRMYTLLEKLFPRRKNPNKKKGKDWIPYFTKFFVYPKWLKEIRRIIEFEDPDFFLMINTPLNQIPNLAKKIKEEYSIPIIYYNADMPVHLPKYGGFQTGANILDGASLVDFDFVITNSEGVEEDLKELGARRIDTLHWAADPTVFSPVEREQDIDVFFYGYGSEFREKWMEQMLYSISKEMPQYYFALGGKAFSKDIGLTHLLGDIPFSVWREFCARSKINLNITRESHAKVRGTSTARPFELGALGCCIISNPHEGLSRWFDIGKEIFVVNNQQEAKEIYDYFLENEEARKEVGIKVRKRVLKDHTFKNRAEKLIKIMQAIKN